VNAQRRSLKVGIFVIVGIVLAGIAVFVIGENRRFWDRKVTYHATWDDVVGLKAGSAVRMGGIDVGSVSDVRHSPDPADAKVYVEFQIARSEAMRIRADSTVTIAGKGLLGDKMLEISVGSSTEPLVPENGAITSIPPSDLGKMFTDAQDIAREAKLAMQNVQKMTAMIADPEFNGELHSSVKALHEILDGVARRDGVAHRMIFDTRQAERVSSALANLEAASANLNAASADIREITARVKSGPGLAHTLMYDGELAQGTTGTMVELSRSLTALRTGNGLGHAIVYGDDSTQHVMGNVSAMSDDMREIVANVKAGRGTLGGLLVDPSIYEDIKSLVGNVERNEVLRALVRYSIKQNEEQRPRTERP
jgi:phospholipid/cholesterol/gamma-HCH transport system substrate-binding protein